MPKKPSLTGKHFDLEVIEYVPERRRYRCRCVCGKVLLIIGHSISKGHTKSCGCQKARYLRAAHATHGMTRTPTYLSWQGLLQSCRDPKNNTFKNNGARGITVCDDWQGERGFQNFLRDMGERPPGTVVVRRNVSVNYTPDNCLWGPPLSAGDRNKRDAERITCEDRTMTISEWAAELGISSDAFRGRMASWPREHWTASKIYGAQSEEEKKRRKSARKKVQTALKSGRLVRPVVCERPGCELPVSDSHHADYGRPLCVEWLCHNHHVETDRITRRNEFRRRS